MKKEHLQGCQIETPLPIVDLAWNIAIKQRGGRKFGKVLDLGAGDAKFANKKELFYKYVGLEIDKTKIAQAKPSPNVRLVHGDAMKWRASDFDLCIGNPPYIRHHKLDPEWRADVLQRIKKDSQVTLKRSANLFVLFLTQALLRTKNDGLVVQIIPYEWVTRPGSLELRDYIKAQGWNVTVLRFTTDIFSSVLTTASVTIIDKANKDGIWTFGEISEDGKRVDQAHPSDDAQMVLPYQRRQDSSLYGLRGLSPGSQELFVLTEAERLHFSLRKNRDVRPCVTSLRQLPDHLTELNEEHFKEHYVSAGKRCWLIRSDKENISNELVAYLASVGDRWKNFTTCTNRDVWYRYSPHPAPSLLFASGFVGNSPKVLVNSVKAIAVGSVYGVINEDNKCPVLIGTKLRSFDFQKQLVSHANNLKKVEVGQLNAVLATLNLDGA